MDARRVYVAGTNHIHRLPERGEGFSSYYQLGRADKSAKANAEPNNKEELKSHYEGSHSLFGIVWQVATSTGWTPHFVKWGLPYAELMTMMADAPRLVDGDKPKAEKTKKNTVDIFQSMLKNETGRN